MTNDERAALARSILDNPLTAVLLDEMEISAINLCVNARPQDHDGRAAYAAEVRAIRDFRRKLNLALEEAKAGAKRAPA